MIAKHLYYYYAVYLSHIYTGKYVVNIVILFAHNTLCHIDVTFSRGTIGIKQEA